MIKKLQIFVSTILLTTIVSGQKDISLAKSIHQIGISMGGVHYQLRDDIIAPLRGDGLGLNGGFSYSLLGEAGRHDIDLRVLYADLSNRFNHNSRAAEINVSYGYMHKVASNESNRQLYVGGLIDWNYCLQYYDNWDDSHIYWLNVYELSPSIEWSNSFRDNHQFTFSSKFSLIALVSRPPKYRYYDTLKLNAIYSEPHEEMRLTSFNEYISFGISANYMYQVRRNFRLGLNLVMNYKTFTNPERIILISYALKLDLLFTLGKTQKEAS